MNESSADRAFRLMSEASEARLRAEHLTRRAQERMKQSLAKAAVVEAIIYKTLK